MICDRCGDTIPAGEEMELYGQTLCEECYMQALSPARACDPWAVHSAQSLTQLDETYSELSDTQVDILRLLEETGGAEREVIAERLQMPLSELERELATLRHMEKVRGELRGGKKIVRLW
jgi:DNA-binding transcriptional ArsR family regulator